MAPKDNTAPSIIDQLFEKAVELRTEKEDFLKRQEANRASLRQLRDAGVMTDEEASAVDDFYPPRKRGEGDTVDAATNGTVAPDPAPVA